MTRLIEITAGEFKAMVIPFKDLPMADVLPILSATDTIQQFAMAFEKLRDNISVELRPNFDVLNQNEVIELINGWIEANE